MALPLKNCSGVCADAWPAAHRTSIASASKPRGRNGILNLHQDASRAQDIRTWRPDASGRNDAQHSHVSRRRGGPCGRPGTPKAGDHKGRPYEYGKVSAIVASCLSTAGENEMIIEIGRA